MSNSNSWLSSQFQSMRLKLFENERAWLENNICENVLEPLKEVRVNAKETEWKRKEEEEKDGERGISKFITLVLERRWRGMFRAIISIANCNLQ